MIRLVPAILTAAITASHVSLRKNPTEASRPLNYCQTPLQPDVALLLAWFDVKLGHKRRNVRLQPGLAETLSQG